MKVDGGAGASQVAEMGGLDLEGLTIAVEKALTKTRLGSWKGLPLSEPPCVTGRQTMVLDETYAFIMEDQTQIDYPKRTAHLCLEEKTFYLEVEGNTGDLGTNPSFWFGPVPFEPGGTR